MKRMNLLLAGGAAACLVFASVARAADHRDTPTFATGGRMSVLDLNDLFVFTSPLDSQRTVLILTVAAFAGIDDAPDTFDPRLRYEFRIDQDQNHTPDLTLRATFGPPDDAGLQTVKLLVLRPGRAAETLVSGNTRANLPMAAGAGMFRAAIFDDPFFFDALAFNNWVDDGVGVFPRPTGQAQNFFGPNVNTLGIVIELPTAMLLKSADRPIIEVSTRVVDARGVQRDRSGMPFVNLFAIPPLPRNDTAQRDLRDAFNAAAPTRDLRLFREGVVASLMNFWGASAGRAGALADRLLLPAVLTFDTSFTFSSPSGGFPNGRRLRDDVADYMLNQITNGAIPTDNVFDDNGAKITDGSTNPTGGTFPVAFPYIGPPNP